MLLPPRSIYYLADEVRHEREHSSADVPEMVDQVSQSISKIPESLEAVKSALPIAAITPTKLVMILAFWRRSADNDLPTSSDSLKRPYSSRRTYRLSA